MAKRIDGTPTGDFVHDESRRRSRFDYFLHPVLRIFGVTGFVAVFWSPARSWTSSAIAAGIFSLVMAAFEYSLSHHFKDAWFQKLMIRAMKVTFAFLALRAVLSFGFLALAWILGT